jgi:hypothetical protein
LFKGVVAAAITAVFVYLSQLLTGDSTWLALLSAIATALILFPSLLWLLGLDDEDWTFLRLLQKRLPKRIARRNTP